MHSCIFRICPVPLPQCVWKQPHKLDFEVLLLLSSKLEYVYHCLKICAASDVQYFKNLQVMPFRIIITKYNENQAVYEI